MIDTTNFYNNSMSDYAVIFGGNYGATVTQCIFQGNTKEIAANPGFGDFIVANCVFSGPFPSGAYYSATAGIVENQWTASRQFVGYLSSEPCLGPAASSSPKPTLTRTPNFTSSRSYFNRKRILVSAAFYMVMLLRRD
jgi:hypothetical protein